MNAVAFIWRATAGQRVLWLCMVVNMLLCVAIFIWWPLGTKGLIDAAHAGNLNLMYRYACYGGVLLLGVNVVWRLSDWLVLRLWPHTKSRIETLVLEELMQQPYSFFQQTFSGELVGKMKDLECIPGLLWSFLRGVLMTVLTLLLYVLVLYRVHAQCALLFSGWALFFVLCALGILGRFHDLAVAAARAGTRVVGTVADVITNMLGVKLFATQESEKAYVARAMEDYLVNAQRRRRFLFLLSSAQSIGFVVYHACSLALLVSLRLRGAVSAGDFALVLTLNSTVNDQLWCFSEAVRDISDQWGLAAAALTTIYSFHPPLDTAGALPLFCQRGAISCEGLIFSHRAGGQSLCIENLLIPAGQRVGIVGLSGSGKTSFVHLLVRLYPLQAGAVYLDGQDIAAVTHESLCAAIALVPQEPSLFHRTVYENIAYGMGTVSPEEVTAAARRAQAHDFIMALEQGYQTLAGERGTKLSGGQRQRIALARAFLKKAPILILDEATAALDTLTEERIMWGHAGQTVLAVAHRLSTVASFDRILVFSEGRIVQDGAPAALAAQPGLYRDLWWAQETEMATGIRE